MESIIRMNEELNNDIHEKYEIVTFEISGKEYHTIWYMDDIDGFLLEQTGCLKAFAAKKEAAAFAQKEGFILDDNDFLISSAILEKYAMIEVDCNLVLNYWNTFSDLAHSLNCSFLGDNREGIVQNIYVKLFYGCNILVKENEEHYIPKWNKNEKRWMVKVLKEGFAILSKALQ